MQVLNIGEQIRSARKNKGITQEELAGLLNMSRQGISHWESGRSIPDASMLLKLSKVLEYSFEENTPFSAQEQKDPEPAKQQEITLQEAKPSEKERLQLQKRRKWKIIMMVVVLQLIIIAGSIAAVLITRASEKSTISMEILEKPLYLQFDEDLHMGRGWKFTLSIYNESKVPFKPERIIFLLCKDERILSKAYVTYEDMLPWMDSDKLLVQDTPLHWFFTCSADEIGEPNKIELILQGVDDNGHELKFSITEPLYPYTK